MRTDLQLIQSALASEELKKDALAKLMHNQTRYINLYNVQLPDRFKGLPSHWYFGILPENGAGDSPEAVLEEAKDLIKILLNSKEKNPIVFISDDNSVHFESELFFGEFAVFFLAKFELPGKEHYPKSAKDAPIVQAAKRKFRQSEASFYLSPYLPNKPVEGWRFFGRKKEVKEIVESQSNYFVIGARRIGKTSLLQEVRRQLTNAGADVFWVECQHKDKVGDVISDLLKKLSEREFQQLKQSGKQADINFVTSLIRKLKRENRNVVLIFDELGNVISKNFSNESWKFIGALRELSHGNEVRVIISAFQEVIIQQLANFEGPFVNFGKVLKVHSFTRAEVEELLISPLHFWGRVKDKRELSKRVKQSFGSHPLVLQVLGENLFREIIKDEGATIDDVFDEFYRNSLYLFGSTVEDIFLKIISYLERYIFLTLCIELEKIHNDLTTTEIKQEFLKELLDQIEIESDYDVRVMLLDRLVLRGLLDQDVTNKFIYRLDCPIIFLYLKKFLNPIELCEIYRSEIKVRQLTFNEF